MSRPAAPESLVRRLCAWVDADGADPLHLEAATEIERLERQLALAQTEIKGHMRVEDDLKADYVRAREFIEQQSKRIAELEKDVARYRWLRDVRARKEYRIDGWEGAMWSVEGLHDPHEKGFDAAIDAALKDRA